MDSEGPKAAGLESGRVAVLTLELNLETFELSIKGMVPGAEAALAMLRMAEDEYKLMINAAWLQAHRQHVVSIHGAHPLHTGRS
jgi:hypothetical protein